MTIGAPGHDGQRYGPFAGLCFEAQHFPDSLHHPDWPSIVRSPEEPYFQRLVVEIGRGAGFPVSYRLVFDGMRHG